MVPQGGRYRSMSPESEAVGGSVHIVLALSYFLPSVVGPSDPSHHLPIFLICPLSPLTWP